MKELFLVRHCEATGQPASSQLTAKGFEQAAKLAMFFQDFEIKRVVASPFTRAVQTIEPFCKQYNLRLETDERLIERDLGLGVIDNWLDKLQATFADFELKYGEGESSNEALQRILSVTDEVESGTLLVSHGNLLALALMHYSGNDGLKYWEQLSNPDVFLLTINEEQHDLKRLWS